MYWQAVGQASVCQVDASRCPVDSPYGGAFFIKEKPFLRYEQAIGPMAETYAEAVQGLLGSNPGRASNTSVQKKRPQLWTGAVNATYRTAGAVSAKTRTSGFGSDRIKKTSAGRPRLSRLTMPGPDLVRTPLGMVRECSSDAR